LKGEKLFPVDRTVTVNKNKTIILFEEYLFFLCTETLLKFSFY
jgi:hypothetical protein